MIAKLLWNPDYDDALAMRILSAYFGKAPRLFAVISSFYKIPSGAIIIC